MVGDSDSPIVTSREAEYAEPPPCKRWIDSKDALEVVKHFSRFALAQRLYAYVSVK